MKKLYILFITAIITGMSFGQTVIINEIHYDNTGADVGEGFEIAGTAGTNLAGYKVVLYNGNGTTYNPTTINLSGVLTDETNGFGFIWFPSSGTLTLQNGAPDGLALIDPSNSVLQFLSYEGTITATAGPANGLTSTDIGVSESDPPPIGHSLQFDGTNWIGPLAHTKGSETVGQTTLSVVKNQIEDFTMYPNPVSNENLYISSANDVPKSVQIFTINGQQVYNKNLQFEKKLNVSKLTKGIYFVKVEEEGKIATRKLIIN